MTKESQLNRACEQLRATARGRAILSVQDAKMLCEYLASLEAQVRPAYARRDLSV
jgi:hypothetical protein